MINGKRYLIEHCRFDINYTNITFRRNSNCVIFNLIFKFHFNLFFDFILNSYAFKIYFLNVFFRLFFINIKYTYGKCQQIYVKTWFQDINVWCET